MSIENIIQESINVKELIVANKDLINRIKSAAQSCVESLQEGGKVHFCGNGGSAADAQHLAAELSGRFYYDRKPLNAEALHVNTSYLTAVANDYSFNMIYSRMIEASAKQGDVLVAISTSGNSENIVKAIETAKQKKMLVVGMTGETGGKMATLCDILINVPSSCTPRIQEAHIMIGHIICELIESTIFPKQ
ncbi:MAG: D-sedoheptulose 7-phosphate isomerase [Bacteroidales bacterium]|nr:D-sedoheptulose 7-phosphate isomerase [Bacteroidales bacterium]MBR3914170.1 D-sedoheptulose 7-phosphate isomerase [Bacteroidales bacterium]